MPVHPNVPTADTPRGLKVFICSYPELQAGQMADRLRSYHAASDGRHRLSDDPEAADIILVGAPGNEIDRLPYLRMIAQHDIIDRYPDKCFSLSLRDQPLPLQRGVYESSCDDLLSRGRVRTGAYARSTFNSLIAGHDADDAREADRDYLFTFIGRASHPVRERIFALQPARPDILIEDSSSFNFWGNTDPAERERRLRRYFDLLRRSRFSLCPRGVGTGSIRLFESMRMGVAPIILADGWVRPVGPDWDRCALFVPERDVDQLERIARQHAHRWRDMGEAARQAYRDWFADDRYFNYVIDNCLDILRSQRIAERHYWRARKLIRLIAAPDAIELYLNLPRYYLARLGALLRGKVR